MAARTRRLVPVSEIGLIPMPVSSEMSQPNSSFSMARRVAASAVPASTSLPEYTSSVFSRKITMSTFSGAFTGDGTPWYQRTGRRHT